MAEKYTVGSVCASKYVPFGKAKMPADIEEERTGTHPQCKSSVAMARPFNRRPDSWVVSQTILRKLLNEVCPDRVATVMK